MSTFRHFRGLAFMSLKGGVGKTSLLVALARRLPGRLALLDVDFSNPVLPIALGIDHQRHRPLKGFRIAPAPWERGELASLALLTLPHGILRQPPGERAQVIEDFVVSIAWQPYDWLLIDTAPSLSQENEAVLKLLDPEVVIVAEPGPLAAEGVARTALFLETVRAKALGVLMNKWRGGPGAGELAEGLGLQDLGTVPLADDPSRIRVPDITRFQGRRLGEANLALKAKRWLAKQGLAAVLDTQKESTP